MYRFALRPKWVLSHVLVLALVVVMVNLGFWQLRRLDQREDRNGRVADRIELAAAGPIELLAGLDFEETDDVEFRPVRASGVYLVDDQVLVLNRSFDGAPGAWVLTPMLLEEGATVVVNRGWVGFSYTQDGDLADVAPPSGLIMVDGFLRSSQTASGLQVDDPDEGVLDALARPDLGRLQSQLPYPLLASYVQLESQSPSQPGPLPAPVPRPELDDGPHLSYAVQWFVFSAIALVGYPLVLRKVASDPSSRRGPDEPRRSSEAPGLQ